MKMLARALAFAVLAASAAASANTGYYRRPGSADPPKLVHLSVGQDGSVHTAKFSTRHNTDHSPWVPAVGAAGGGLLSSDPGTTGGTQSGTFKVEGGKVKEETSAGTWEECTWYTSGAPEEEQEQ